MAKYQAHKNQNLFDAQDTVQSLSAIGNPLEALKEYVDFELFRNILEDVILPKKRKSNAGRRPIDPVLMFKIIVLQRYYGLGDEQIEYQIKDRTSFRNFLGIECVGDVPDEKTVWKFKDVLSKNGTMEKLFDEFHVMLDSKGLIFNEGKIIDASFVVAPRQRNTHEENKKIKDGEGDKLWNGKDEKVKKSHKDVDARWTIKRGEKFYGYKDHAKIDAKSKLIDSYHVTSASVHDSQCSDVLITDADEGQDVWMDAGYVGKDEDFKKKNVNPIICEKGFRNHPLTEEQKKSNRLKSKVRSRVEHVFGFMEQSMKGLIFRGVGMVRATFNIGLTNLVYNIFRYAQLIKGNATPV